MHLLFQVNWLAVAVTAIVTFALGALWYGPLFGKAWLSAVGLKEEELGSSSKAMILTFILNIVTTMVIALAIEGFDIIHWPNGLILGVRARVGVIRSESRVRFSLSESIRQTPCNSSGIPRRLQHHHGDHPLALAVTTCLLMNQGWP